MRTTQAKSFERFYYERVGIGEGCGCAELIIGTHDHETRAHHRAPERGRSIRRALSAVLHRIAARLARAGLSGTRR